MNGQTAKLTWRDGKIPVSSQFDDPYFSIADGLEETRHVFLAGNDLPARFRSGFRIAELGFGTGLNALAAWRSWNEAGHPGSLCFTSFEAYPMSADDMAHALAAFPELAAEARQLLEAIQAGDHVIELPGLSLHVVIGDARRTLANWEGRADAWFLDGFSPAKNPELWESDLMAEVCRHSAPGATLATYSAAGAVRRRLEDAGFDVVRADGFGRKRHMTRGTKRQS